MLSLDIVKIQNSSEIQPITEEQLEDRVREFLESSESLNTKRAHLSDWNHYTQWCADYGRNALPATPETILRYMAFLVEKNYKPSTISRRLATISGAHQAANYDSPTRTFIVRKAWDGLLRGNEIPRVSKDPIRTKMLRRIIRTLPNTLRGTRDHALLLLGFAGAFRRSELVSILIEDIEDTEDGLSVTIRRSKTDQIGQGELVGIPYGSHPETCPVRAVKRWLQESGLSRGYLFRAVRNGMVEQDNNPLSDRNVWYIVRRQAKKAGLDPKRFGAHSLRSGLATSAAEGGASERAIMDQTRHKSVQVVRGYIRRGSLFKDNAASFTGL